jgi:DNA-binding response OmpR family regulator
MTAPLSHRLRQGKRALLVIEDDPDTSAMLGMYFAGHNYQVDVAARGDQGLTAARRLLPDLVLLDINLPDLDGYTICRGLRESPRTSHIPIIFLTEKASLSERVQGLGAGAQDYVTKPFDLEELRLRVQNLIARSARENVLDPRSNLPTGSWVDDQLRRARERAGWHILECRLDSFQPFVDQNGFVAGDEVLQFAGQLLRETIKAMGTPEDFVGHPAHDTFLVITGAADTGPLAAHLQHRFNDEVKSHYSFMDREQGYVLMRGRDGQMVQTPLMTLTVSER